MPAPIPVELSPHSPAWLRAAESESLRLQQTLGDRLLVVHHIGSTAIPGIHAKPIIDLLPVVREVAELDEQAAAFRALGYQGWGEYGIAGRRYYTLDDPATGKRRFQLHCFAAGDSEIIKHTAFRDYLRAHPQVAAEYDREKRRCRDLHPDNSHAYSDAKAAWIQAVLPAATAYSAAAKLS